MKTTGGRKQMLKESQALRLVPWAWSLAWLLTGLGFWISVVNSQDPSPNFFAYIALGALGWGLAALVTASVARDTPGMLFRLVGWLVAGLASIALSIFWMLRLDAGFLALIAAPGVAGVLGGVAGSMRRGAWRWVSGILLGLAFLILSLLNFYASYILWLGANQTALKGGAFQVITVLGWVLPGALFGLLAGFAVRWILGISKPKNVIQNFAPGGVSGRVSAAGEGTPKGHGDGSSFVSGSHGPD
jgi:hypothetical protein